MRVTSVDYRHYEYGGGFDTALFWRGDDHERSYPVSAASKWRLTWALRETPGKFEGKPDGGWTWTRKEG